VELALFPRAHASVSVVEFICLVLLLKRARAERIFEFGTYKGISITQLALNVPEGGEICTLDLPDESINTRLAIADPDEVAITVEKGKGSLVPSELKSRITFLKQDSAVFDESPYAGRMDFVFVDGAHHYDYVKNDSEKGWRMLKSGGIIAWHDFRPLDPGVVKYLLESTYKPLWVSGTSLAFARKP
jgi:predicted O-methyltransferase YrrM